MIPASCPEKQRKQAQLCQNLAQLFLFICNLASYDKTKWIHKKKGVFGMNGTEDKNPMAMKNKWALLVVMALVFGLIADFMLKRSEYKSAKMEILAHGVFSIWVFGAFIPIIMTRDSYYEKLIPTFGQEYADTLMGYMTDWILPVMIVAAFVAGIIGGLFGRKIFKKHFERAGIA